MFLKYSLLSQTQHGPPIPLQTTFPTSMTLWLHFIIHPAVGWYSTNLLCPSLNTSKTTPPNCLQDQVQTWHDFQKPMWQQPPYLALFLPNFVLYSILQPTGTLTFLQLWHFALTYLSKCCSLHLIMDPDHIGLSSGITSLHPLELDLAMLPPRTSTVFCTHYYRSI